MPISAEHGLGFDELIDALLEQLPAVEKPGASESAGASGLRASLESLRDDLQKDIQETLAYLLESEANAEPVDPGENRPAGETRRFCGKVPRRNRRNGLIVARALGFARSRGLQS